MIRKLDFKLCASFCALTRRLVRTVPAQPTLTDGFESEEMPSPACFCQELLNERGILAQLYHFRRAMEQLGLIKENYDRFVNSISMNDIFEQ